MANYNAYRGLGESRTKLGGLNRASQASLESLQRESEARYQRMLAESKMRAEHLRREAELGSSDRIKEEFKLRSEGIQVAQSVYKTARNKEQYHHSKGVAELHNYFAKKFKATISVGSKVLSIVKTVGLALLSLVLYLLFLTDKIVNVENILRDLLYVQLPKLTSILPHPLSEHPEILLIIVEILFIALGFKALRSSGKLSKLFGIISKAVIFLTVFLIAYIFVKTIRVIPYHFGSVFDLSFFRNCYLLWACGLFSAMISLTYLKSFIYGIFLRRITKKIRLESIKNVEEFKQKAKKVITNTFGKKIKKIMLIYLFVFPLVFAAISIFVISPYYTVMPIGLKTVAYIAITLPAFAFSFLEKIIIPTNKKTGEIVGSVTNALISGVV